MEGSPLEVVGQVLYFYWFDSHVLWELELVLEGFVVFWFGPELFAFLGTSFFEPTRGHNHSDSFLGNHPPEIWNGVRQRSLRCYQAVIAEFQRRINKTRIDIGSCDIKLLHGPGLQLHSCVLKSHNVAISVKRLDFLIDHATILCSFHVLESVQEVIFIVEVPFLLRCFWHSERLFGLKLSSLELAICLLNYTLVGVVLLVTRTFNRVVIQLQCWQ